MTLNEYAKALCSGMHSYAIDRLLSIAQGTQGWGRGAIPGGKDPCVSGIQSMH